VSPPALAPIAASRQESCLPLAVHNVVDDLCATALILCMSGGNAGDYAAEPHPGWAFYLGKAPTAPVHAEKSGIVHMPRRNA
jgi:hypothetical protein